MPVGAELVDAREQLGLSIEDVAAQTKIKIERLSAIERMDIEGLPTLVYLKGFLKAYAAAVQLDADAVTKRYLAELPSSFTATEASPPLAPATASPERASSYGASQTVPDLPLKAGDIERDVEIDVDIDDDLDDVPDLEWSRPEPTRDVRSVAEENTPRSKRDRMPLPPVSLSALRTRTAPYARTALVAVIALATGWILGANFGTTNSSRQPTVTSDDVKPENDPSLAIASTPGTDVDLAPPAVERAADPDAGAATNPDADAQRALNTSDRARTIDVSGAWALTNRLEPAKSGGDRSFNRGFRLQLQQRGNRVSGRGQQWMENGRSIAVHNRPSIRVEGIVSGRRLELNVIDGATSRFSAGKFVMNVTGDETMRGRFVGTAANARGMSLARRMDTNGRR
jgi:transcriptional regulator with XRE-family HTH domain